MRISCVCTQTDQIKQKLWWWSSAPWWTSGILCLHTIAAGLEECFLLRSRCKGKLCFQLICSLNIIRIGTHLHIKKNKLQLSMRRYDSIFLNWKRETSWVPLQLILPTIHERFISPRRDPDVVLFNFISHNSFLRLPLSLLQQCLREVWNSPYEIHIHPMWFSPNQIISRYLVVYIMEAKAFMWTILILDKGFADKRAFLFLRWRKPCLAVSAM